MKTIIKVLKSLYLHIVTMRFLNKQKTYGKNSFQKHYFEEIQNIKTPESRFQQYHATAEIEGGIDIMQIKQKLLIDLINTIDKDGFVTLEIYDTGIPMRKRVMLSLWVSLSAHC